MRKKSGSSMDTVRLSMSLLSDYSLLDADLTSWVERGSGLVSLRRACFFLRLLDPCQSSVVLSTIRMVPLKHRMSMQTELYESQ